MLELKSHNFIQITTYFQTIGHFAEWSYSYTS